MGISKHYLMQNLCCPRGLFLQGESNAVVHLIRQRTLNHETPWVPRHLESLRKTKKTHVWGSLTFQQRPNSVLVKQHSDIMRNFTRQSFCLLSVVRLKLLSCDLFRGWLFLLLKRLKWLKVTHELLPTGIQLTRVQDFKITCSHSCSEVTFVFAAP